MRQDISHRQTGDAYGDDQGKTYRSEQNYCFPARRCRGMKVAVEICRSLGAKSAECGTRTGRSQCDSINLSAGDESTGKTPTAENW